MPASPAKLALLTDYILRPGAWDSVAERWSRSIPHDFPGHYPDLLREMVTSGECQLSHIECAGRRLGFVVWRVEGGELVIVAMFGMDGADLTATYAPQIESLARREKCTGLRFHTMRPGLIRKAEALGYRVSEIILRKSLPISVPESA